MFEHRLLGTGDAELVRAQAARLRNLAKALRYDLAHYRHPQAVVAECTRRITKHEAEAAAMEERVAAWAQASAVPLPEQMAEAVRRA